MPFGNKNSFDISILFKNTDIREEIRSHLVKVYSTLALTVAAAMIGAAAHVQFNIGGIITALATFAIMFALGTDQEKNPTKRVALLSAFGFFQGCSLGPLVELGLRADPSILITAFLGTTCVFVCFTVVALFARRRSLLFLAGTLSSLLTFTLLLSFAQIFLKSRALFNINLYLGLFIFCGYVLYDTQLIIERADQGTSDFAWDALELFIDFVAIFVRILIILLQNTGKEKKTRRRSEDS